MTPQERAYGITIVAMLVCMIALIATNHDVIGVIGFAIAFNLIPVEHARLKGIAAVLHHPTFSIVTQVLLVGTAIYAHAAGIYQFPTGAYLVPYLAIPILYVIGLIAVLLLRRTPGTAEHQPPTHKPRGITNLHDAEKNECWPTPDPPGSSLIVHPPEAGGDRGLVKRGERVEIDTTASRLSGFDSGLT